MKVLVTGACGQLGKVLAKASAGSVNEYIFTDLCIDSAAGVPSLDITDAQSVEAFVKDRKIDVIVNCASYTAVDRAEEEADKADMVNNAAVAHLAQCAAANNAVLIHISSDYVFDGTSSVPYTEESPLSPLGVYGRTKADSERAVMASGCRYIIFRTSWLYSVEGKNFVKRILEKSAELPELNVIFDQVGTPTYAPDLASLICTVIEEGMLDRTGLYNYSNEGVCSWYDFAHEICFQAGHTCHVRPCHTCDYPRTAERPHFSVLDKTKVKNTFGIDIPHWKDSLMVFMNEMNNVDN